MENPGAMFHAARMKRSSAYYTGVLFVGALHIVAIWALLHALGPTIVKYVPPITQFIPIADQTPTPDDHPPLPPVTLERPVTANTVDDPIVVIESTSQNRITVGPTEPEKVTSLPPDLPAATVTGTHTTPPYPAVARRLGMQGSVKMRLTILGNGAVGHVELLSSSGFDELDQVAVSWVQSHWRYRPATRGGVAVESTTLAAVTFNLTSAR